LADIKTERISFASTKHQLPYPDFLDIQLKSFKDFFQLETNPENRQNEGLYRVFSENFPITDARNNFVLEFLDYFIDPPRYSLTETLDRGLTYSVPLKAKLKLYCTDPEHEDFETIVQDVYLGMIPYMTPKGTFVINGAERVVFHSCTGHQVFSSDNKDTLTEHNCIPQELSRSKDHGWNFQPTSTR
jgi:DNA-directed RNA polymerase subunit beta